MGSVWKAEHQVLGTHVAIKIIDPTAAARNEFNLDCFWREAKILAMLRSPHIVKVLDLGSDADSPYLVMELLEGQTLSRRLSDQGRLSLAETSRVLNDVCAAMSVVHQQGVVHRDLKPDNIVLCGSADQRVAKLVDFGIAKSIRADDFEGRRTGPGYVLGTPTYMSPEQCRGLHDIDHRADLWAIGVIAYECLVGEPPFESQAIGALLLRICVDPLPIPSQRSQTGLSSAFDAWFAKAVARDRSARFQSASELGAALGEVLRGISRATELEGEGASVASPGPARPERDGARRSSSVRFTASQPRESSPPSSSMRGPARDAGALAPPANRQTNGSIDPASPFARRAERWTPLLIVAAIGIVAHAVWMLRNNPGTDRPIESQSPRPPLEFARKVLRSRVPSGRPWRPAGLPAPLRSADRGAHSAPTRPDAPPRRTPSTGGDGARPTRASAAP